MKKTIATDLDGCLLAPIDVENLVCFENRKLLKKFKNVLLISGRNSEFIKGVCKELKIKETFASYNGGAIYIDGKEVVKIHLDSQPIKELIQYATSKYKDYNINIMDDTNGVYAITDNQKKVRAIENKTLKEKPRLAYKSCFDKRKINKLLNENLHLMKVNFILNDEDKMDLYNYIIKSNYSLAAYPCAHSVEITNINATKGKALDYLINTLNISRDDVFVCGDDNNDIDMFDGHKYSFLVKKDNYNYLKNNYLYPIKEFKEIGNYLKEK